MNINQDNINNFFNKYIRIVDDICNNNNYDINIRHLLYIIVPAFIYKYGINNETIVINTFKNVKIFIKNSSNKYVSATFNRRLKKDNDYYTEKYIIINEFKESSFPSVIDNIVHEFNHAVNSYNNEIIITDKLIKLRSGISTLNFNKNMIFIEKSNEYTLEELLNTNQTEEIINIIKSFSKYRIDNQEISNLINVINRETGNKDYVSDAYYYQKTICRELINNKTFTPTINNMRFKGNILDIEETFDNVIGINGSYKKLNNLLTKMHTLILKYSNSKLLKNMYLNKIRSLTKDVNRLIIDYEEKCIFK